MIPNFSILDEVEQFSLFDQSILRYKEGRPNRKVKFCQLDPLWANLVSFDWKFFNDHNDTIFGPI